jgi:radical SAM protein (TIGR01212 family)
MKKNRLRYRSVSSWFKELFGGPVRKITLDAGLGCPNRDGTIGTEGCIYCNPRGSGTGAFGRGIGVSEQIDRGIALLSKRHGCTRFIAYFQSFTNTYAEISRLADLYGQALARPEVVGLAVGTRPDCVPDDVLDLLAELGRHRLVWIEYGLQSVHNETLRVINRGHDAAAFFGAVERAHLRGLLVAVHLILGLPGETLPDMVETARAMARVRVHGVKLHPLYVVRGTALEQVYNEGSWQPLSEEQALEATLSVLEVLPPEVVIHRMTSDPHPEELVAPQWMLNRRQVRQHLREEMERRDFVQGAKFESKA